VGLPDWPLPFRERRRKPLLCSAHWVLSLSRRFYRIGQSFCRTFFGKKASQPPEYRLSKSNAENNEGDTCDNDIKRSGPQPSLEKFPFLPEKKSDQDIADGIDRGPREVVKKKYWPGHFRRSF
jgi:hypothetical protein